MILANRVQWEKIFLTSHFEIILVLQNNCKQYREFLYMLPASPLVLMCNTIKAYLSLSINVSTILLTELQTLTDFTSFSTNVFVPGFHAGHHIAFSQHVSLLSSKLCRFLRLPLFFMTLTLLKITS